MLAAATQQLIGAPLLFQQLPQQGLDPEHREGDQDPQDPEEQQEQETHHADRGRAGSYCKHASPLLHRLDFMTQPRLGFVSQRKPWHVV